MKHDIVHRAQHRRFHQYVDDRTLDSYARHCGSPSGIGRLCLLDDRVLAEIVRAAELPAQARVLDIGCGRGFLARWLQWYRLDCRYSGVDYVPEALAAARKNVPEADYFYSTFENLHLDQQYDRIFALESAATGSLTRGMVQCIAAHLAPGGRYVVTLASLDGSHDDKIMRSIEQLQKHTMVLQIKDLTLQVKDFAATMYSAFLLGAWDTAIKSKMSLEAAYVLQAIENGTFNYMLITGTRSD